MGQTENARQAPSGSKWSTTSRSAHNEKLSCPIQHFKTRYDKALILSGDDAAFAPPAVGDVANNALVACLEGISHPCCTVSHRPAAGD